MFVDQDGFLVGFVGYLFWTMLLPVVVTLDRWRNVPDPDYSWAMVGVLPLINLLGVVAYLDYRRRQRSG